MRPVPHTEAIIACTDCRPQRPLAEVSCDSVDLALHKQTVVTAQNFPAIAGNIRSVNYKTATLDDVYLPLHFPEIASAFTMHLRSFRWTDVAKDTVDALHTALRVHPQLRVFKQNPYMIDSMQPLSLVCNLAA